jgi:uncharacterized protein (TIGR03067 family)
MPAALKVIRPTWPQSMAVLDDSLPFFLRPKSSHLSNRGKILATLRAFDKLVRQTIFMKKILALALTSCLLGQTPLFPADEEGFQQLFDGRTLTGWAGRPQHWSVEDGAITGRTTKEHPAEGNNFLIWQPDGPNGVVADFELRLSYKIVPNNDKGFANSGIQYRSKDFGKFVVGGYQADFEAGKTFSGILYEERMDGILAQRGQKTVVKTADGKTKIDVTGSLGKSDEIQSHIKDRDWNDYVIIAKGNHLQHFINGVQTVDVVDERSKAAKEGILALQLHAGEPMTVQFKNIRIKKLKSGATAKSDMDLLQGDWVLVEMIANGQKLDDEAREKIKLKVKGNEYSVTTGNGEDQGKFTINSEATPKTMDVSSADGANELLAIYEISDDEFRACYAGNGAGRPKEFTAPESSERILSIYKRKR